MIDAESEIVSESIEDVEENRTERDIVRTSEGNEQIGDDSDETINNVAANVETLDEETQLIIAQLNKILTGGRNTDGISFKKVDMNTLNRTTAKVNRLIELIQTKNITQTNNLIKAAGVWVADQLGLKKYKGGKKKDPWWISPYEQRIQQYRINRLFKVDQKKVYNEFNGQTGSSNGDIPNYEESRTFWSRIWSVEKEHNKEADWLSG